MYYALAKMRGNQVTPCLRAIATSLLERSAGFYRKKALWLDTFEAPA
ncbi:hypothetical protein BH09VER1_BH09VER1_25350 [soil metagenome]